MLCGIACVALGIGGTLPAAAVTKAPGLLGIEDLPGSFQQVAPPTTLPSFNTVVVDQKTCNETVRPIAGISGAVSVFFARTGVTTDRDTVSEYVLSFPDAKTAKVAFALEARSATAGAKCRMVGFVPPGTTTPVSIVNLAHIKFPKVGSASVALGTTPTGGLTLTTVTFLRGPYIVIVSTPGTPEAPSRQELQTIVTRAERQLST